MAEKSVKSNVKCSLILRSNLEAERENTFQSFKPLRTHDLRPRFINHQETTNTLKISSDMLDTSTAQNQSDNSYNEVPKTWQVRVNLVRLSTETIKTMQSVYNSQVPNGSMESIESPIKFDPDQPIIREHSPNSANMAFAKHMKLIRGAAPLSQQQSKIKKLKRKRIPKKTNPELSVYEHTQKKLREVKSIKKQAGRKLYTPNHLFEDIENEDPFRNNFDVEVGALRIATRRVSSDGKLPSFSKRFKKI